MLNTIYVLFFLIGTPTWDVTEVSLPMLSNTFLNMGYLWRANTEPT